MNVYHGVIILFITSLVTANPVQAHEYLEKTKGESLSDIACTKDQIARFNGAKWVCEPVLTETMIFESGFISESGSVAVDTPALGSMPEGDIVFSIQGDGKAGSFGGGVFHDSGPVCKEIVECKMRRLFGIKGWMSYPVCTKKLCCFSEAHAKWACI